MRIERTKNFKKKKAHVAWDDYASLINESNTSGEDANLCLLTD